MSQPHLNAERVVAGEREPGQWLFVLHGIYGAGRNWGSVARRVVRSRPDWGACLVDLRQHGASRGFPPPHTIESAAADLSVLAGDFEPAGAVLGHSFGGKVALAWARHAPASLRQVWVIDSTPEARAPGGSAWEMLSVLERLPGPFADRASAVRSLETAGVAGPVAQWMATNLEAGHGGLVWRFDLAAIRAMLEDFFRADLWDVLEAPPAGVEIRVVRALGASTLSDEAARRMRAIGPPVHLHEVEGGHWLNADNPDALEDLLARHLPDG